MGPGTKEITDDPEDSVKTNHSEERIRAKTPERQLWFAVLKRAADDLVSPSEYRNMYGQTPFEEALVWIDEENLYTDRMGGFEWVCIQLGLDISIVREQFEKILDYRRGKTELDKDSPQILHTSRSIRSRVARDRLRRAEATEM